MDERWSEDKSISLVSHTHMHSESSTSRYTFVFQRTEMVVLISLAPRVIPFFEIKLHPNRHHART